MRLPVLLLASNSPRRRQLLALGGWEFKVYPANIDENHLPGEGPGRYVLRLAETKARTAASEAHPGWLVVAADTIVVDYTPHEGRGPSPAPFPFGNPRGDCSLDP